MQPFWECMVVFTDQSCREGSCKRRKPHGRCKWSQRCRAQLHSHQCFRSSQGHSSHSHIHSCSRCVCYCMCLHSDRCWAAVCIHLRHRCKTDLETKKVSISIGHFKGCWPKVLTSIESFLWIGLFHQPDPKTTDQFQTVKFYNELVNKHESVWLNH